MAVLRLPRLPQNWLQQPSFFSRAWNEAMSTIESILNQLLAIPEIQEGIAEAAAQASAANEAAQTAQAAADSAQAAADSADGAAGSAQTAADAAADAANDAQSTADGAQSDASAAQADATAAQAAAASAASTASANAKEASIVDSYVKNFGSAVISCDSTGSVTINGHDRIYGNPALNPNRAVTGATFASAATIGQIVRVYYSDPTRAGGSVTYQFTIDPTFPPVQTGDTHVVGAVIVPAAGSQNGNPLRPPGFVYI